MPRDPAASQGASPRRRLDFSGPSCRPLRAGRSEPRIRPQHKQASPGDGLLHSRPLPDAHHAPHSAKSALRHDSDRPPVSPASPKRNSLSSHASDVGRRLAQERSRNDELMQQIHEMEQTITMLRRERDDGDVRWSPDRMFSSPPVATPIKRDEDVRLETPRKESAEVPSGRNNGMGSDPAVAKLLEQASKLLAQSNDPRNTNTNSDQSTPAKVETSPTRERMEEYHELVTAFHLEQESHGELDGEELIPREDILWLFHELKWRFDEIYSGYAEDRSNQKENSLRDSQEWKDCLAGFVKVAQKAVMQTQSETRQPDDIDEDELNNDPPQHSTNPHILQKEVASLNQRLVSFAAQHKETVRSLHDDMEATRRDHQEQLTQKSQHIQNLEARISEQEEYIARRQMETHADRQWVREEKRRLELSKEGSAARIRYLEGMLRSLQMELREAKTPKEKGGCANNGTPTGAAEETGIKEPGMSSPPVFMRVLTSPMEDTEPVPTDTPAGKSHSSENTGKDPDCQRNCAWDAEREKLLDKISSLGTSLAESETSRANLLEEFQQERTKYMAQYKQMSDVLKQIIGERAT